MTATNDAVTLAGVLARAITDKAAKELPSPKLIPATVLTYTSSGNTAAASATVHIDSDPLDVSLQVSVLTTLVLKPGDRVMVLFDPPEGAYVLGASISSAIKYEAAFTWPGTPSTSASPPITAPFDCTLTEIVATTGGAGPQYTISVAKDGTEVWTDHNDLNATLTVYTDPSVASVGNTSLWTVTLPDISGATDVVVALRFS